MIKLAKSTLIPLGLYRASTMITLLLSLLLSRATVAFQCSAPHQRLPYRPSSSRLSLTSSNDASVNNAATVTVKATDLDDSLGLTSDERTVVNVHRVCSPSVVYVTSVLKSPMGSDSDSASQPRRRRRWRRGSKPKVQEEENNDDNNKEQKLPRGTALGSGSGFVVDSEGYIVTNYHVIQRAYETNDAMIQYDNFWDGVAKNATTKMKNSLEPIGGASEMMNDFEGFINGTVSAISGRDTLVGDNGGTKNNSTSLPAQVFVRFGTNGDNGDTTTSSGSNSASYLPCDIVDVVKELDVAVLKIRNPSPALKALAYGSSANLLVGQSLLAIGNPFGLDRTITSGLVSALGRSVTGVAGNDIKNCIQTDAAINPGNSGGPLLNLNGQVVGVNTMIISTSGSSAGIGFAVPGDNVEESTASIVDLDKERKLRSTKRKGRGWLGVDVATSSLEGSLKQRLSQSIISEAEDGRVGAFVTSVAVDSPLSKSQDGSATTSTIDTTSIRNGIIHVGDRIVNVGGTPVTNGHQFAIEMKKRVDGEQLALTVENVEGEKRVVYVTLGKIPLL